MNWKENFNRFDLDLKKPFEIKVSQDDLDAMKKFTAKLNQTLFKESASRFCGGENPCQYFLAGDGTCALGDLVQLAAFKRDLSPICSLAVVNGNSVVKATYNGIVIGPSRNPITTDQGS